MIFFHFLVNASVVWRLTHLLGKEDGPFGIIFLLRKKAGSVFFSGLLDCFYCLSIWIAFPFGMYEGENGYAKLLYWIALSGAACLLEQATAPRRNNAVELPPYNED